MYFWNKNKGSSYFYYYNNSITSSNFSGTYDNPFSNLSSALLDLQENSIKNEEKIIILLNGSNSDDIEKQIIINGIIQIKAEEGNSSLIIRNQGSFYVNNILKLTKLKLMFSSSINIENFIILSENSSLSLEVL